MVSARARGGAAGRVVGLARGTATSSAMSSTSGSCATWGSASFQMFDATLAQWCGVQPGVCSMGETCGDALVVEHNGDVYSCDHFVYPEYKLGNIRETDPGGDLPLEEAASTSAWRSAMPCRPSACAANTTSPAAASAPSTASRPVRTAAARTRSARV
ncbi:MAG: SPASM domain-containing protein [Alistipes sp.]